MTNLDVLVGRGWPGVEDIIDLTRQVWPTVECMHCVSALCKHVVTSHPSKKHTHQLFGSIGIVSWRISQRGQLLGDSQFVDVQ